TAFDEPRVLVGGVVGDEIEQQLETAGMRLRQQAVEVVERAEHRFDAAIIGYVVSEIGHRRRKNRRQPNRVDAERSDVIQPLDYAGQVSDAVAVAVLKRARVDLIYGSALPPPGLPVGCSAHGCQNASEVEWLPSERVAVAVSVDLAAADMVGGADQSIGLHPFDPLGGGVVADAHLTLEPRSAGLLSLEHDRARLAVLALLGAVAGGQFVVEPEETVLGFLGDRIDVFGLSLAAPVLGDAFDFLVAHEGPVHPAQRARARLVEHVALAEQLLGALLAQDRAAVDSTGDVEADARRQVGLDHAGDDVDRRALRGHDQVDAGGAALLAQPLDQHFDFLADGHHQVGEFVDDQNDLRQDLIIELLFDHDFLAGFGIEPGLDASAERLAAGHGRRDFLIEIVDVPYPDIAHHAVAALHFLDG